MVRKIISIILCVLFVASLPLATNAESYTAADTFDHSKADIFKSLLNDVSIFDHYVLFKSSDDSYFMIVGDLVKQDDKFVSSESCTVYKLSDDQFTFYTDNQVSVSLNNQIYYSDLGSTFDLYTRFDLFSFIAIILLSIIALCCLIRPIFNFVLRLKGKA